MFDSIFVCRDFWVILLWLRIWTSSPVSFDNLCYKISFHFNRMFEIDGINQLSVQLYSGPSILRPPMGPLKCGLILKVVLNVNSMYTKTHFGTKFCGLIIMVVLSAVVIEGQLYFCTGAWHGKRLTRYHPVSWLINLHIIFLYFQVSSWCIPDMTGEPLTCIWVNGHIIIWLKF